MKTFRCCELDKSGVCVPNTGCGALDYVLFEVPSRMVQGYKFRFNKNETVVPEEDWDNDRYLKALNKSYWLEKATIEAETLDIFQCPKCGNDV